MTRNHTMLRSFLPLIACGLALGLTACGEPDVPTAIIVYLDGPPGEILGAADSLQLVVDPQTPFLDELGDIPQATQVKLLRVLEQREITRVGATRSSSIDIRLVAATNKDLEKEVREGRFREDLFYRLNVVRVSLPPLRERPEDVAPLVRHFLKELAKENGRAPLSISQEALGRLTGHAWRGNIRELRNAVEQMVIFAQSSEVALDTLPSSLR